MNKDTIDRLHKLESERYGLQERIESLKKVFAEKPRDLIVEIKAIGWHSGHAVMRFNEMPQEIMDALKKVSERMAKELDEVNRQKNYDTTFERNNEFKELNYENCKI